MAILICYNRRMTKKKSVRSATKIPILVKKSDSKKGSLWHEFSHRRIIRQHGGDEIPEGDLHAVTKYVSPIKPPDNDPKDTEETLSYLQREIEHLKKRDQQKQTQLSQQSKPPEDFEEFFDEEPIEKDSDRDDNL
jgi:hypothetical protein